MGYLFLLFFDGGSVFFESSVSAFEVDGAEKIKKFNGTKLTLKKIVYAPVLYGHNE